MVVSRIILILAYITPYPVPLMKTDKTINSILTNVSIDVSDNFGIELTNKKILEIVNSQFSKTPTYTKEKKLIKFDYFGKLQIKEGREEYVTEGRLKNIMMVLKDIELLPDYRYVINDKDEVDYHSIVKFVDSQIKTKLHIDLIVDMIKVVIDGKNIPLKHLTND